MLLPHYYAQNNAGIMCKTLIAKLLPTPNCMKIAALEFNECSQQTMTQAVRFPDFKLKNIEMLFNLIYLALPRVPNIKIQETSLNIL